MMLNRQHRLGRQEGAAATDRVTAAVLLPRDLVATLAGVMDLRQAIDASIRFSAELQAALAAEIAGRNQTRLG